MKTAWVGVPRRRVWTFPPQLCQVGSFLLSPLSLAHGKGGWKQVWLQNMSRVQGRPQNSPVQSNKSKYKFMIPTAMCTKNGHLIK